MRAIWRWMLPATTVVLLASPTRAQQTPRGLVEVHEGQRRGFWGGLSIGAGGEAFDLRDGLGYSDQLYRPTVSLRLGGTVGQHVRLGGEVLAWINDHDDVTESLSSLLFITQFYPTRSAGLYLKGGLGLGRNEIDFHDGFAGLGDTGFAGLLGAGWEVRLGRRFYLNPAVDLVEHRYTGRGGDRYRERLINFGMGVLFQSGR
jgi:Outer membrane protein beta-barrel domain